MDQELHGRAERGDPGAQLRLAVELDRGGAHDQALVWLRRASDAGHAPAQYVLGARLLVGRAAPPDPAEGTRWVSTAASQGHPQALALMSVLATYGKPWTNAVPFLTDAAKKGDTRSRELLALLGDAARFDWQRWTAPVEPKWQFESPRIGVIEGLIPQAFCGWFIDRARPKLEAARVRDPGSGQGRQAGYRTNSVAGFSLIESDMILQMVNLRVAAAVGVPLSNQEPTNVLHYRPGEEYESHFDFITPSEANTAELAVTGQRTTTVLIYLNDGYQGGETEFPKLDWRYKGKAGDALVFWNTTPDGEPDARALHAGLPLTQGEKWIYSKWIRARPYPLI